MLLVGHRVICHVQRSGMPARSHEPGCRKKHDHCTMRTQPRAWRSTVIRQMRLCRCRLCGRVFLAAHRSVLRTGKGVSSCSSLFRPLRQRVQKRTRLPSACWSFVLFQHMPVHGYRVRAARRGGKAKQFLVVPPAAIPGLRPWPRGKRFELFEPGELHLSEGRVFETY